jgi:hypothetical protein
MSFLNKRKSASLAASIVKGLQTRQNRGSFVGNGRLTGAIVAGIESLEQDGAAYQEVDQGLTNISAEIEDVRSEAEGTLLPEGEVAVAQVATNPEEVAYEENIKQVGLESATYAAAAFGDLGAYFNASRKATASKGFVTHSHESVGSGGVFSPVKPALEAFDQQTLNTFKEYSIAYNLLAPRQDAFGEALFPTIVGTPDQSYLEVNVERPGVYTGAVHKLNGDIAKFDKRNLIEAFRDSSILENQDTRLVPYPDTNGDNEDYFVADTLVANTNFDVNGVSVPTRPLRMGAPAFDYMGLCSHPGLASAGLLDQTDAIDRMVTLSRLTLVITNTTDDSEVAVYLDTSRMPRNQFVPVREGHWRDLALRFSSEALKIKATTKAVDGADLPAALVTALSDRTYSFRAKVDADLSVETGTLETRTTAMKLVKVVDGTNQSIGLDDTAVVALLAGYTFRIEGYELNARRTNSNRRSRGLLLDRDKVKEIYEIMLHPPMSIQKPVAGDDYASDLDTLVKSTHVRISNLAVTTLLNYADLLKDITADQDPLDSSTADIYTMGDFEGIARLLVTPFYDEVDVDLLQVVNTLTSKDRLADISGYFVGLIQELAYRMIQQSGYKPALEVMGSGNSQPELIIATDNRLSQFIMIPGDDRTAGPSMSHKLVDTQDNRMRNTIFLTFGSKTSGELNVLGFGNLVWIPELVSEVPVNRTGATVMETMVQPRFRHIVHLPILARINVANLDKVLQTRTPIDFNAI